MEDVNIENLNNLNINEIALNKDKFGSLTFDTSAPLLTKLQALAKELDELNYKDNLSPSEINQIDQFKNQLVEYIRRLQIFDISNQPNPKDIHDAYEIEITNYYNDTTRGLRPFLTYLRQEELYKISDKTNLKKQQKEAIEAKKEFEQLSNQLKDQISQLNKQKEEIEKQKNEIASGKGELAVKVLAKHFSEEVKINEKEALKWLKLRGKFYWGLVILIALNIAGYILIFIFGNQLKFIPLETKSFFTIEYLLLKLAIVSTLSYALVFTSKQYSINSNLASINRHRRNVAMTIDDFLETKPDPEVRSQIIKQGTESMFKQLPIGYIGKNEAKENSPVYEIVNNILKEN